METVNYNQQDIYNMDESPFQVQYLSNTGQRVYTRRGSNQVWRKQGNQRKHVTLIGCVSNAPRQLIENITTAWLSAVTTQHPVSLCHVWPVSV
jgi:hypothetical protein